MFPRGLARKFVPKFIGPLLISRDFGNSSYEIQLPRDLVQRGMHNVFHALLLQMHVPNDDRLFPGCSWDQISGVESQGKEWAIKDIRSHSGKSTESVFEIEWASGDVTWLPYQEIKHLHALERYLEVAGVDKIEEL
ncbi:hypothetical protein BDN71DRAFT_1405491, partial [Pleurotus eryngii]